MAECRVPNPERRPRPGVVYTQAPRGCRLQESMADPKHTAQEEPDAKTKPNREDAHQRRLERSLEQGLEDSFPTSDPVNVT
jgi:hypothetical protein